MKAIAVYPGQRNSMHLEEIPQPKVTDIPDGRGVLVKVLRVIPTQDILDTYLQSPLADASSCPVKSTIHP